VELSKDNYQTSQLSITYSVYAVDMDGDGDMDVLSASSGDKKIAWFENTDSQGTFSTQKTITTLTDLAVFNLRLSVFSDSSHTFSSRALNLNFTRVDITPEHVCSQGVPLVIYRLSISINYHSLSSGASSSIFMVQYIMISPFSMLQSDFRISLLLKSNR
jgi:hypothetical protein